MKALYVSHNAQFYGAPKSLLEYVVRIREKGVEPIVVIPDRGKLKAELDKSGIRTEIIPYQNCVYKGTYDFVDYVTYIEMNYKAVQRIKKLIKEEQIDIVHTNTLAVNVGALAAYIAKVPHIWHFREYLEEDFNLKPLNPWMTKKLIQSSSCCIAISEGIKRKYKRKYSANIICLYDGIEDGLYYNPIKRDGSIKKRCELLIAGRVCEGKGQWDAIHAVEILVSRGITVHLNIVGDGESAFVNRLKRYVKDKELTDYITFHPYTSNLQKMRMQSNVVLVCSKMEALGRVTAESMLAGKIVIGADTGGTLELIGENEDRGYLYQYAHPENLAGKIQYVLENEGEIFEKEQEAQEFMITLTDMEKYTAKLVQIYQKAIERKNQKAKKL